MKRYVVGFCFNEARDEILLIEKNKPEWQKGRLNGIGGKIEDYDASPKSAMYREGLEEANIKVDWQQFAHYSGPGYELFIFRAFDDRALEEFKTMEAERIVSRSVDGLPWRDEKKMIWNLNWLIPLALDKYVGKTEASEYNMAPVVHS